MLELLLTFTDKEKKQADMLQNVVDNIDAEFGFRGIECNELNKEIIKRIEQGTLNNNGTFTDRFGRPLFIEHLSTGCKAALLLAIPGYNKVVNLDECGLNARDVIVNLCNGKVIYPDIDCEVDDFGKPVEIKVNERIFSTVDEFNHYMSYERLVG